MVYCEENSNQEKERKMRFYPGHSDTRTVHQSRRGRLKQDYQNNALPQAKSDFTVCPLTFVQLAIACPDRRIIRLPNGDVIAVDYRKFRQELKDAGLEYPRLDKDDVLDLQDFVNQSLSLLFTEPRYIAEKKIAALFELCWRLGYNPKLAPVTINM